MSASDQVMANLQADLNAGPWLTLRAIADRLEELGQADLAEAYHWLAQQGKFPVARYRRSTWAWRKVSAQMTDRSITLPRRVHDNIPSKGKQKGYPTVADAFAVAAFALIDSEWLKKAEPGQPSCRACGRRRRRLELHPAGFCEDCEGVRS
jgi:hypothetical protein